jgi:hypothetical protein
MTISTTATRVDYAGDGTTTAFAVPFQFFGPGEIEVIERSATGVETVRALGTHYTVAGGNGSTGTVTATAAPATGVVWTIRRNTLRTQPLVLTPDGGLPAKALEQRLDRQMAVVQEQDEILGRALRFPRTDGAVSPELLSALARAGKVLGFGSAGEPALLTITGGVVTSYAQWGGTAGGTANARTLTPSPAVTAYAAGLALEFLNGAAANTGAATIAVSGLAAQSVLRPDGSALSAGDMPSGALLMIRHDGTAFRLANLLAVANAATESASGIAEIATQTEANTGTDDARFITPLKAARRRAPSLAQASGYTVVAADNGRLIRATGTWVLALTAAATLGDGFTVRVRNVSTGVITVDPNGAETVNGAATLVLPAGATATLECDGTGWVTSALDIPPLVYASGAQTMTAGGLLTLAHGLGAAPTIGNINTALECTTAQANWLVGEFIQMGSGSRFDYGGAAHAGYAIWADATNIYVRFHLTNVALLFDKTTGGAAIATPTSWRLHVRATRQLP